MAGVKIRISTAGIKKTISDLQKTVSQSDRLAKSLKAVVKTSRNITRALNESKKQAEKFKTATKNAGEKALQKTAMAAKKVADNLAKAKIRADKLKETLKSQKDKALLKAAKEAKRVAVNLEKARIKADKLKTALKIKADKVLAKAAKEADKLAKEFVQATIKANKLKAAAILAANEARKRLKLTSSAAYKLGQAFGRARVKAKQLNDQVNKLKTGIGKVSALIGTVFITAGILASIKLMKDFEFTMARVRAISGSTDEEFKGLSKTARTLGATTIFSARQAASGMTFLSQAGFSAGEVIKATRSSLLLAQAANIGLAESSDLVAKSIRQFSLDASDSGRVADVLSKAAASSNTSVTQMGEALKYSAPLAAQLGLTIEQTAGALGIMGNSGIQATQAGTSLKNILLRLQAPSKKAREVLDKVGLSQKFLKDNSSNLVGIFQRLKPVLNNVSDANAVFGRIALAGGLSLVKNADSLQKLNTKLVASTGFAQTTANTLGDTLSGALKGLKSGIEEAALQFGDSGFAGNLKSVIKITAGAIAILNGMEKQFIENTNITAKQIDKMRQLANILKVAGYFVTGLVTVFAALQALKLITYFINLRRAMGGLIGVITTVLIYFGTQEVTVFAESIARWKVWFNTLKSIWVYIQTLFKTFSLDKANEAFKKTRKEGLFKLALAANTARLKIEELAKVQKSATDKTKKQTMEVKKLNTALKQTKQIANTIAPQSNLIKFPKPVSTSSIAKPVSTSSVSPAENKNIKSSNINYIKKNNDALIGLKNTVDTVKKSFNSINEGATELAKNLKDLSAQRNKLNQSFKNIKSQRDAEKDSGKKKSLDINLIGILDSLEKIRLDENKQVSDYQNSLKQKEIKPSVPSYLSNQVENNQNKVKSIGGPATQIPRAVKDLNMNNENKPLDVFIKNTEPILFKMPEGMKIKNEIKLNLNIKNSGGGSITPKNVNQSVSADGEVDINVQVEQAVLEAVNQGALDRVMSRKYNIDSRG